MKKSIRKYASLLFILGVMVLGTAQCACAAVKITPTSKTVNIGDKFVIKPTLTGKSKKKKIKWSVKNKAIATVKNGKVTAKQAGTTTVYAKVPGFAKKGCKITVRNTTSEKVKKAKKDYARCLYAYRSFIPKFSVINLMGDDTPELLYEEQSKLNFRYYDPENPYCDVAGVYSISFGELADQIGFSKEKDQCIFINEQSVSVYSSSGTYMSGYSYAPGYGEYWKYGAEHSDKEVISEKEFQEARQDLIDSMDAVYSLSDVKYKNTSARRKKYLGSKNGN